MNAMLLLKAMSEIAPEDIEAAMQAGSAEHAAAGANLHDTAQNTQGIRQTAVRKAEAYDGRHLRLGGWLAAAACLMLVIGAVMFFRSHNEGFVLAPSMSDILEETGTALPETTAAVLTQTTEKTGTTQQTVTKTHPAKTVTEEASAAVTENTARTDTEKQNPTEHGTTEPAPQRTTFLTSETWLICSGVTPVTTTLPPDTTEPPRTTTASTEESHTTTAPVGAEPVYTLPEVEILNPFENGGMEPNSPADVIAELNEMPEGSFVFRQFREPEEAYNTHLRNHLEQNRDVIAVYTVSDKWTMELHSWEVTGSGKLNLLIAQPDDGIHMFVKGVYVFLISKPDGELPEINEVGVSVLLKPVPEVQE